MGVALVHPRRVLLPIAPLAQPLVPPLCGAPISRDGLRELSPATRCAETRSDERARASLSAALAAACCFLGGVPPAQLVRQLRVSRASM